MPKWRKNAVSQKAYEQFVNEMYKIGRDYGYFNDILQPALRKNGKLFLTDLGHFVKLEDVKIGYTKIKLTKDQMREQAYGEVDLRVRIESPVEMQGILLKFFLTFLGVCKMFTKLNGIQVNLLLSSVNAYMDKINPDTLDYQDLFKLRRELILQNKRLFPEDYK